jgi:hypothetical protein
MQELYIRLARHLEHLIMGYPYTDELFDLLVEMFSPAEAQVALAIPNDSVLNISLPGRNFLYPRWPKH